MAGRNAGKISVCHQRASLCHPQQKADRRRRTGDSLSRRSITTRQTIGCCGVAAPSIFKKNVERLEKFLQTLRHWKSTRHAIEFRHKTWFDDEIAECLTKQAVAVCMSDAPDWPMWDRVTTDLVY